MLRSVLPEFYDHSVYLPCTSLRRFHRFSPFCYFVESITYVESIPPRGVRLPPRAPVCLLEEQDCQRDPFRDNCMPWSTAPSTPHYSGIRYAPSFFPING